MQGPLRHICLQASVSGYSHSKIKLKTARLCHLRTMGQFETRGTYASVTRRKGANLSKKTLLRLYFCRCLVAQPLRNLCRTARCSITLSQFLQVFHCSNFVSLHFYQLSNASPQFMEVLGEIENKVSKGVWGGGLWQGMSLSPPVAAKPEALTLHRQAYQRAEHRHP